MTNTTTTTDHTTVRPASRFLSREECVALARHVAQLAVGGGTTEIRLESRWFGYVRWARNQIATSGDVRDNTPFIITRSVRGAMEEVRTNQVDGPGLEAAVRRAERLLARESESPDRAIPKEPFTEPLAEPKIWSDVTYGLDAGQRAEAMRRLVRSAEAAGMLSAGYVEVSAQGRTVMGDDRQQQLYYPYTEAQYSVTVRDPSGKGSGWAGVDWHDWTKIDGEKLSRIALDKCLQSRNPVRLEPGRYTTILEPQAVCDLCAIAFSSRSLDRRWNELMFGPYAKSPGVGTKPGMSKLGLRVFDERITVTSDCMDPELGFPPFSPTGEVYYPVTWVKDGVLKELAYDREYAVSQLGKPHGQPASGAFKMSGGTTSIEEMMATTKRGVLVTRFWGIAPSSPFTLITGGYTRDGLWLIEDGKIAKPIWNFRIRESPLYVLNKVEQLGAPQRVFSPGTPVVVPPLKVRDFNFVALSDAI